MTVKAEIPGLQAPSRGLWTSFWRVSNAIRCISTARVLILALILWLLFLALIQGRPFGIAALQDITGGANILDMTFTRGPGEVYAVLDALGDAGRAFDLTRIVPLDLVFPFTYMLFLSVGISWALEQWLNRNSSWFLLNLAPLVAGLADYCENAGVITLLLTYPARVDPVASFTSIMYVIKFAFSTVSFFALFTALAIGAVIVLKNYLEKSPASR